MRELHDMVEDEAAYELILLIGSETSTGGVLNWNRREGTWSFATDDPQISRILEGVMAEGFSRMRKACHYKGSFMDMVLPVKPTERGFVVAIEDMLIRSNSPFFQNREVTDRPDG